MSSISFGDVQGTDSRLINFAGEGFFKVAPYNQLYFVINTPKFTIKALTASFNVKAYAGEKMEISVLTGTLEVSMNDNDAQHFILNASEKLVLVDKQAAPDKVSNMDAQINRTLLLESINSLLIGNQTYSAEASWKDNSLVFKDKTLPELEATFERWFNVNLYIKNAAVKNKLFTGNFTDKNLEQVLNALQMTNFFHYNITEQEVVVY
jgi:ferric-dicitrate binding protein FerR (iron transport regulator)